MDKCRFACNEVKYLGYVLSPKGIVTDPDRIVALRNRRSPHHSLGRSEIPWLYRGSLCETNLQMIE